VAREALPNQALQADEHLPRCARSVARRLDTVRDVAPSNPTLNLTNGSLPLVGRSFAG
jgi:hypothetical protein